jgi:non-ribosomal peptide synthetase component F
VRQAAEFLDRAHERAFGRQQPGGGTLRRIAEHTWQLIIGAHMALKPEVFEPMETVARRLAEMFGGTYEGWRDETGFANEEAVQQALRLMATEGGKA